MVTRVLMPMLSEWHVVCQRVRKVILFLLWGTFVFGLAFFFLVSSWCLVRVGSFGFAELPVVHKTWVT